MNRTNDFEYIAAASGPHGNLNDAVRACDVVNAGLTEMMDGFGGPDHTDTLDASCNTCKHFQRRPMTPQEKSERNLFGMPGQCALKEIAVMAMQRGIICIFDRNGATTNRECYVNRRTGRTFDTLPKPCASEEKGSIQ